jgi:streptogramin lyase
MFRRLFRTGRKDCRPRGIGRRPRLTLECLEGRLVLSALINFDGIAEGTVIDHGPYTQVSFTNPIGGHIYARDGGGFAVSPPNVVSVFGSGLPFFNATFGAVEAHFVTPEREVSIDTRPVSDLEPLGTPQNRPFLEAYNAAGAFLGRVLYAGALPTGGGFQVGDTETLTFTRPTADISYVRFSSQQSQPGPRIFGLFDNLQYDATTQAVSLRVTSPPNVSAGAPFTVTVSATDSTNDVFKPYTGTVHFTSSDPAATLPDDYTFTPDDHGTHSFTVTLGTEGLQTLTATDTARPDLTGTATGLAEFSLPAATFPQAITAGPDGNLWFTSYSGLGRITPDGAVTTFALPNRYPAGITAGPDGNVWFAEGAANRIGRITPDGVITEFPVPTAYSSPSGITAGPDGNLWFTEANASKVGRITPDGAITELQVPTLGSVLDITAGPDGNLWFTETGANKIGRVTPDGAVTEFPLPHPNGPGHVTAGADGNLWFTEANGIGRVTPDGAVTEFPLPWAPSGAEGITLGPDGNVWFTDYHYYSLDKGNEVGFITPDGTVTEIPLPSGSRSGGITTGPDGNLWLAEGNASRIARLTPGILVNPAPGPASATGHAPAAPAGGSALLAPFDPAGLARALSAPADAPGTGSGWADGGRGQQGISPLPADVAALDGYFTAAGRQGRGALLGSGHHPEAAPVDTWADGAASAEAVIWSPVFA